MMMMRTKSVRHRSCLPNGGYHLCCHIQRCMVLFTAVPSGRWSASLTLSLWHTITLRIPSSGATEGRYQKGQSVSRWNAVSLKEANPARSNQCNSATGGRPAQTEGSTLLLICDVALGGTSRVVARRGTSMISMKASAVGSIKVLSSYRLTSNPLLTLL